MDKLNPKGKPEGVCDTPMVKFVHNKRHIIKESIPFGMLSSLVI